MEIIKEWKCFGGTQRVYQHQSSATNTSMEFAVFEPQGDAPRPVLYFLSGLTCTWENVVTKGGTQCWAAEHNVTVICPDTSPRGQEVPDRPDEYDLGCGAGFYLNATEAPWSQHYRMEEYVTSELPRLIEPTLAGFSGARGIFGHSMGGHGALRLGLKNPSFYSSISAFSPVVAPTKVPWGKKAFAHYLGANELAWEDHDSCCLIEKFGCPHPLLVDVGTADSFLDSQLRPELLEESCEKVGVALTLRRQPGYDHSYYFISTFMRDHIAWHAARLIQVS
jgi:S-formylglutathione hydrolase